MKVKALRNGTYPTQTVLGDDWKLRRIGDVFTLYPRARQVMRVHDSSGHVIPGEQRPEYDENGKPKMELMSIEQQFSPRWMEKVDDSEPEFTTPAPVALQRQTEEIKKSRRAG